MFAIDPDEALVPIFKEDRTRNKLVQIGTAVFVEFEGQPFLFTAAHVTDSFSDEPFLVPAYGDILPIDGYLAHIDLPPELPRTSDQVDIAYSRLSDKFARGMMRHFRPLSSTRLKLIEDASELRVCSVYGLPASKGKFDGQKFISESYTYRSVAAAEEVYLEHALDIETNIVLQFRAKDAVEPVTLKKKNIVSPKGVSGGAIFAWPPGYELSNDWSLPKLVGIFHTYKKRQGLMIGTSLISVITAIQLGQMKDFGGIR